MGSWRALVGGSVLWSGLSAVFDGAHVIVLPVLVATAVEPNWKASALGLLSFAALALAALAQPYLGSWSDRLRPRRTRLGFAGFALIAALAGLALLSVATNFPVLILAVAVAYTGASAMQAAQQGLLPELFPPHRRALASGAKQFADLAGASIAFAILALLVRQSVAAAIGAVAGLLAGSYVLARVLVREPTAERGAALVPPSRWRLERADFRGRFGQLVAARLVFLFATYAIGRFLVFLVESRLELSATAAAAATAQIVVVLALVTAVSAIGWGAIADRLGRGRISIVGSFVSAVGVIALLGAADLGALNVAGIALALGSGAFAAANWAATVDAAPPDGAARALAVANLATWGAAALAGLLGPVVDVGNVMAAGSGYTGLLLVCLVAYITSAGLTWVSAHQRASDALVAAMQ